MIVLEKKSKTIHTGDIFPHKNFQGDPVLVREFGAHLNWWAVFSQNVTFPQVYSKTPKIHSHLSGGCKLCFDVLVFLVFAFFLS